MIKPWHKWLCGYQLIFLKNVSRIIHSFPNFIKLCFIAIQNSMVTVPGTSENLTLFYHILSIFFFLFWSDFLNVFFFAHWIKSKFYINIRVINLSIFSLFKWVGILCSFCGPWAVFLVLQQNLLVELGQKHLFQVTEVLMRPLHLLQANLGLYHWSQ